MKANLLSISVVVFSIFFSCSKDSTYDSALSSDAELEDLKYWYSTHKITEGNWLSATDPDWTRVYKNNRDSLIVYEIPLIQGEKVFSSTKKIANNVADLDLINSQIILIIVKRNNQSTKQGYYMNVVNQEGRPEWDKVHYASPVGIDGMLNYYTLDGQFLNGWLVKKGNIVSKLKKRPGPVLLQIIPGYSNGGIHDKIASARNISYVEYGMGCGNIMVNDYQLSCVTAGDYQNCEPYLANSYTVYVPCTSENDPDGPGTAGDPGGMGEPDPWENPDNYGPPVTHEMQINTPSGDMGTVEIDGCNLQMDQPDEKDPNKGSFKTIAKVNFQVKTARGTVFTEWTDNSGRTHVHVNFGSFYNGFFKSFRDDLLKIGTGINMIFEMFKEGKPFVSPVTWAGFYTAEADYMVDEMQEYYKAKKEYNKNNGTQCKPKN